MLLPNLANTQHAVPMAVMKSNGSVVRPACANDVQYTEESSCQRRPERSDESVVYRRYPFKSAQCIRAAAWPCKLVRKEKSMMTTQEVANQLVQLCSEGKFAYATESLYSPDIVSMEARAPPGNRANPRASRLSRRKATGGWRITRFTRRLSKGRSLQASISPLNLRWTHFQASGANVSQWKRSAIYKVLRAGKSCTKNFSTRCNSAASTTRLFG